MSKVVRDQAEADATMVHNLHGSKGSWIVAALMFGTLLSTLDTTIVSTAMPHIVSEIQGLYYYSWAFTAYMVTSTIFIPLFGKMSDLFGRKRIYLFAMAIFLVGSTLSGFAWSMPSLIAFRAIQGVGGAGLIPVAMAIIGDLFSPEKRRKIQGTFAGVFALGSISGPLIGGALIEYLSWRWGFWINIPLGLSIMLIIYLTLKENKHSVKPKVDYLGALLLVFGIGTLMIALTLGGVKYNWKSPQILSLFAVSFILLCVFLYVETRVSDPIVPFALFKGHYFSVSVILIFFMGGALFSSVSFIPLYVQGAMGVTASQAGYILTPGMLALAVSSVIVGFFLQKMGARIFVILSFLELAIVFYMLANMTPFAPIWYMYLYVVLLGLGFGILQTVIFSTIQDVVQPSIRGIALSMAEFFHVIGGILGITVMGMVMNHGLSNQLQRLASAFSVDKSVLDLAKNPNLLMDEHWKSKLPSYILNSLQDAMSMAINSAFLVIFVIVLTASAIGLLLRKKTTVVENTPIQN